MRTYKSITIWNDEGSQEEIEKLIPWLKEAEFEDAEVEYDDKLENIIWKNGIWLDGVWRHGTWKKGIWKDGWWLYGTWINGTWEKGTWQDGYWEGGRWLSGRWEGGRINGRLSDDPPIGTFQSVSSKLKTNQISLPKEIRQIKDPTLYAISDILVRM